MDEEGIIELGLGEDDPMVGNRSQQQMFFPLWAAVNFFVVLYSHFLSESAPTRNATLNIITPYELKNKVKLYSII